jgi:hypothetical protein
MVYVKFIQFLSSLKLTVLCIPSQKGLLLEAPHLHNVLLMLLLPTEYCPILDLYPSNKIRVRRKEKQETKDYDSGLSMSTPLDGHRLGEQVKHVQH